MVNAYKLIFNRNDQEYSNLQLGIVDANAYTRVYIPLNHYYNTMNFDSRQDKKIRQDFDFQVLVYIYFEFSMFIFCINPSPKAALIKSKSG